MTIMTFAPSVGSVPMATVVLPSSRSSPPNPGDEIALLSGRHLRHLPEALLSRLQVTALHVGHNLLGRPQAGGGRPLAGLAALRRLTVLNAADNRLVEFPGDVALLTELRQLNLAANELKSLPPAVGHLVRLVDLHLDFNLLTRLPDDICAMRHLTSLTISHNHLTEVPPPIFRLTSLQVLDLTGNLITSTTPSTWTSLRELQTLGLRANRLTGTVDVTTLQGLQELDISHNDVRDLQVTLLQTLDCSHNGLQELHVNGQNLETLVASNNRLGCVQVTGAAPYFRVLDLSRNLLDHLPDCLRNCDLTELRLANNRLDCVPDWVLGADSTHLETLDLSHNLLTSLPPVRGPSSLRRLYLEHNQLTDLPTSLFISCPRLEELNVSCNQLRSLPPPGGVCTLRSMFLSRNQLDSESLSSIASFSELQVLQVAYNGLTEVQDSVLESLPSLRELSLAGNNLHHLPESLTSLRHLQQLRVHGNQLEELPDLVTCTDLQLLDVSCNDLQQVALRSVVPASLTCLDLSSNPRLRVDHEEFQELCSQRSVAVVDVSCTGRVAPPFHDTDRVSYTCPWDVGFSEFHESGARLYVELRQDQTRDRCEALLLLVESRDRAHVRLLRDRLPEVVREERNCEETETQLVANVLLAAVRLVRAELPFTCDPEVTACHLTSADRRTVEVKVASIGRPASCLLLHTDSVEVLRDSKEVVPSAGSDWLKCVMRLPVGAETSPAARPTFPVPNPEVQERTLDPTSESLVIGSSSLLQSLGPEEVRQQMAIAATPTEAAKRLAEMSLALRPGRPGCVAAVRFRLGAVQGSSPCGSETAVGLEGHEDDVEKYRCWEYMLEQNHKLLFTRELQTLARNPLVSVSCHPPVVHHRGPLYTFGYRSHPFRLK